MAQYCVLTNNVHRNYKKITFNYKDPNWSFYRKSLHQVYVLNFFKNLSMSNLMIENLQTETIILKNSSYFKLKI